MGMAAFRINEEERQALEAQASEVTPECPMPEPEPEPEAAKTATVAAKKPAKG